jgi:hypothetical protein
LEKYREKRVMYQEKVATIFGICRRFVTVETCHLRNKSELRIWANGTRLGIGFDN